MKEKSANGVPLSADARLLGPTRTPDPGRALAAAAAGLGLGPGLCLDRGLSTRETVSTTATRSQRRGTAAALPIPLTLPLLKSTRRSVHVQEDKVQISLTAVSCIAVATLLHMWHWCEQVIVGCRVHKMKSSTRIALVGIVVVLCLAYERKRAFAFGDVLTFFYGLGTANVVRGSRPPQTRQYIRVLCVKSAIRWVALIALNIHDSCVPDQTKTKTSTSVFIYG